MSDQRTTEEEIAALLERLADIASRNQIAAAELERRLQQLVDLSEELLNELSFIQDKWSPGDTGQTDMSDQRTILESMAKVCCCPYGKCLGRKHGGGCNADNYLVTAQTKIEGLRLVGITLETRLDKPPE